MWALFVGVLLAGTVWARWRRTDEEFVQFFVSRAFSVYARLWHGCSVHGGLQVPRGQAALVVSNHTCSADPALLQAGSTRGLSFLVAASFYASAPFRWLFNLFHCVPVTRNGRDLAATREALRRLKEGRLLCVFPEGNLSNYGRERLRRGKCGAAYLALKSRAPVYPVFIARGPQSCSVFDSWAPCWMGPPRPHLYYGQAVDLSAYYARPIDRKLLEEVTAVLMSHIAALNPRMSRINWGVPADSRFYPRRLP